MSHLRGPRLVSSGFSRASRSAFWPVYLASFAIPAALAIGGCQHKGKGDQDVPTDPKPATHADSGGDPSANKDDPDEDFKPSPGYVRQREANGTYVKPRTAPPPVHEDPPKPMAFDAVPEIKLTPTKDENGHCGEFELGGGEKIYLDCMTDDYGVVAGAAKTFASSAELESVRGSRKLPAVVDHRKDGTEGAVLDQGRASTCTSFSLIAAADHAAAHFLGQPANLSPMHSWARYHTPKMSAADQDNVGKGLTDLPEFPYDAKLATDWQHGSAHPDSGKLHKADSEALVDITNITRLDGGSMNEIKSALAAGQDVWFSIKAAHGLAHTKKNADGESEINDFDWHTMPSSQRSGHAIVLAGYEDTPHGTFYLIHNSWGTKWGTGGYAWIWEKTLRTNIGDAYVLQVKPTERAHSKRTPHVHAFKACRSGLAPDAATSECVPPCPDSGPRVNGVCPTAGQCPDGEVNLDGKCELSAPVLDKTLSNGVKVSCGLSGCTYLVPNGQAGCTRSKGCDVSCAAPRFMLGSGSRGLTCSG